MTETEQLKEEAEKQYMLQRIEAVRKYIHEIADESIVLMKRTFKADLIELAAFMTYFIALFALIWFEVPDETRRIIMDCAFYAAVFAMLSSWAHRCRWREKEGEWTGAIQVLKYLGILPEEQERGNIDNKKRVWSEGIAMVKRWAEKKAAELKKGFAPA